MTEAIENVVFTEDRHVADLDVRYFSRSLKHGPAAWTRIERRGVATHKRSKSYAVARNKDS